MTSTPLTRTLQEALPEKVYVWNIAEEGGERRVRSEEIRVSLPWEPFVGTIAVAPDLEAISALSPGPFGGNMDVPDVRPGNTVYLPVFNEGALHEERHGVYRMLRLQATLTPSGDLEITGDVLPVSKSETAYP